MPDNSPVPDGILTEVQVKPESEEVKISPVPESLLPTAKQMVLPEMQEIDDKLPPPGVKLSIFQVFPPSDDV